MNIRSKFIISITANLIVVCCSAGISSVTLAGSQKPSISDERELIEAFKKQSSHDKPSSDAPSDQVLLGIFTSRRAEFDKLQKMVSEDSAVAAYFSELELSGKLSAPRKKQYKELLSKIYLGLLVVTDYGGKVRFIFASGGGALGDGWLKGIEYLPSNVDREGKLLRNLDNAYSLPADVYLRKIESDWYVVFQRTQD